MMNYSNYLYIAIRAAIDAGKAIMDIYTDPASDFEIERKADNSPLTKADKAAHKLIMNVLSVTPYPILSEEGKDIPHIALIQKGVPVLGVIYVPVRKELYFSADSVGAYKLIADCDLQPSMDEIMQKATRLPVSMGHQGIVVVASRSHQRPETTDFIENLRKQGQPVTLISSGSSLKICLVAEGSADIYPRFAPTMEWDTAAGHAIARGAGCDVFHIDGRTPLKYNKKDLHNPWFIVKPLSSIC